MSEEEKAIKRLEEMKNNYSLNGEDLHYANILYYLIINLQQENEQLKKQYYKFYKYENNPNGSDYCFCQKPCDSNMSLRCFLENGEILGFMSETLVINHPEIKEIDLNEFIHQFVKPLIKEKQHLKENNKSIMEELLRVVGLYNQQKSILDEIRECVKGNYVIDNPVKFKNDIWDILDKVGKE